MKNFWTMDGLNKCYNKICDWFLLASKKYKFILNRILLAIIASAALVRILFISYNEWVLCTFLLCCICIMLINDIEKKG